MKKSRLAIALGSLFTITLVGTLGLSLAWFTTARFVEFDNLSGSVLTSYFDKVDYEGASAYEYGSEQNPFVITRPKHWENLAKLHYAMPGFSGNDTENPKEYYFEIGKQIGGTGDYVVYNYDDEGKAQQDQKTSRTLNLNAIDILPPLGSTANPFSNHIKGNSITIKNFTVGGEGYGDLGIFGYVGERGTCENLYFSSFTIDVSKASPMAVSDSHAEHASGQEDHGYFGFLCGHLYDSKNFTNVYVNSCTLKGELDSTTSNITDRYGYYGHVNMDSLGGQSGIGSNYEFTLSADATHQYFAGAYDTDKSKPVYTRRTEEAATAAASESKKPVMRDGYTYVWNSSLLSYTFYAVGPDGNPMGDPVSEEEAVSYWEAPLVLQSGNSATLENAVTYTLNESVLNTTTYTLNGDSPKATGAKHNYSLSTLGTYGYPSVFETKHYQAFYKDANDNYVEIPPLKRFIQKEGTGTGESEVEYEEVGEVEVRTETSITELYQALVDLKPSNADNRNFVTGKYVYYDLSGEQWKYVELKMGTDGDGNGTDMPAVVNFSFPAVSPVTIDASDYFFRNASISNATLTAYLQVDNNNNDQQTLFSGNVTDAGWFSVNKSRGDDYAYLSVNAMTDVFSYSLTPGTHSFSVRLECSVAIKYSLFGSNTVTYRYIAGYGSTTTANENTITVDPQTNIECSNLATTSCTFSKGQGLIEVSSSSANSVTLNPGDAYVAGDTVSLKQGHASYDIYGREVVTAEEGSEFDYEYATLVATYSPLKMQETIFGYDKYKIDDGSGASAPSDEDTAETWLATATGYYPDESQTTTSYIADPAYTSPTDGSDPVDTNPITLSGYKAKNMDLVGGDVDFFSWRGINIIAIPGQKENADDNPIKIPEKKEKFYATTHTPSSIVMYIKNTSNASDDANDTLGTIDFQYVTVSLFSIKFIETSEPMFIKGGSNTNNIRLADNYGKKESVSNLVYHVNVDNLTEFGTMAASYCALDKYGNIIGRFEGGTNSLTSRPAFTNFTSMSKEEALRAIDTYVLVLGCKDDTNYGTWITKVDFSYKAEDGYGGTFGSVEYRDAEDKADNTIFNFYLTYPAGVQSSFEVQVQYVADTDDSTDLLGTYTLTISTTTKVKLTCFLYYSNYTLNIVQNGTILQTATSPGSTSVTISP
ncbi:MAG: hypothetical protein SPG64_03530 [Candidatus Enteromonas sp.]|nr:hypothetical protein [Candidatus Enteromonas sp.]